MDVPKHKGKYIKPSEWNKILEDQNIKLIDVRNVYEVKIGSFNGRINPNTTNFRNFPSIIKKLDISKYEQIAMYCTGGIRCEKASAYLKQNGFKNVYQLEGGILAYFDYIIKNNRKDNLWNGECFVFDDRVSVNKHLKKGKYSQCYGCRRPITNKDKNSKFHKKGVYCKYCFHERTSAQKKASETRQLQIQSNEKIGKKNSFKKLTFSDFS